MSEDLGAAVQDSEQSKDSELAERTDAEMLSQVDGIGPETANRLLLHFGSGRKTAQAACRYWGELVEVDGVTEETAREMFDRMHEADVFHDLRGY